MYKIVLTDNCPKYDNKLFQLYIAPIDQRWLNGMRLKNQSNYSAPHPKNLIDLT